MQITLVPMLVATFWAMAPLAQGRVPRTARSSAPSVDLGYATYQGYHDDTYGLNVWKRYFQTLRFPSWLTQADKKRPPAFAMPLLQSAACDGKPLNRQLATGASSWPSTSRLCAHKRVGMASLRSMGSTLPLATRTASS